MKYKHILVGDIVMRFNVFICLQGIFHVNKVGSIMEDPLTIEEKMISQYGQQIIFFCVSTSTQL